MALSKRILLVEDEKMILETLADLLSPIGYVIKSATDGSKAVEVLRLYRPDLIISDIMMPGMDGIELLARIKSSPEWNDIPVILLTAKKEEEDRIQGLETGADAYLSKPFNFHELKLIAHNLIGLKENIIKGFFLHQQETEEPAREATFSKALVDFLNSHFTERDLTLPVLAHHFGLSSSGFKKKLKRNLGKTFQEFLSEFRLNKARTYLVSQDFNVNQVAGMTGFKSAALFSDSFRKQFGVTPSSLLV